MSRKPLVLKPSSLSSLFPRLLQFPQISSSFPYSEQVPIASHFQIQAPSPNDAIHQFDRDLTSVQMRMRGDHVHGCVVFVDSLNTFSPLLFGEIDCVYQWLLRTTCKLLRATSGYRSQPYRLPAATRRWHVATTGYHKGDLSTGLPQCTAACLAADLDSNLDSLSYQTDLFQCALVSQSWLPRTQSRIFDTISLGVGLQNGFANGLVEIPPLADEEE
ncbi:hypothetical protein DFH06DRAFT_1289742, partial [Mycena polygramma]